MGGEISAEWGGQQRRPPHSLRLFEPCAGAEG
jgi:hypothetical protein